MRFFMRDSFESERNTLLMIAAKQGKAETVEFLLDNGADIHKVAPNGSTALMQACRGPLPDTNTSCFSEVEGYTKTVEILIARGAKVNHQNNNGDTPLMYAAMTGTMDYGFFCVSQPSRH